jgi:hypothetical protein
MIIDTFTFPQSIGESMRIAIVANNVDRFIQRSSIPHLKREGVCIGGDNSGGGKTHEFYLFKRLFNKFDRPFSFC